MIVTVRLVNMTRALPFADVEGDDDEQRCLCRNFHLPSAFSGFWKVSVMSALIPATDGARLAAEPVGFIESLSAFVSVLQRLSEVPSVSRFCQSGCRCYAARGKIAPECEGGEACPPRERQQYILAQSRVCFQTSSPKPTAQDRKVQRTRR